MSTLRHYTIATCMLLCACVLMGYAVTSLYITTRTAPVEPQEFEHTFLRRGSIESIDLGAHTITLATQNRYAQNGVDRILLHITPTTYVEEGIIKTESGVIYYEDIPQVRSLEQLSTGMNVMVYYAATQGRFEALLIRYGSPIPGL